MNLINQLLGESPAPSAAAALAAHVARSRGPVRTYAETLVSLEKAGADKDILERHARHASRMLGRVKRGVVQENNATVLLDQLHAEISESDGDMTFVMNRKTHGPFVTAFKKKFKVDVHHYDEVGTGVYLYLDAENTSILRDALTGNAYFNDLVDKLGYILLRKGTQDDIDYGGFGDALSQWIFTQVVRPDSGPDDEEGQNYTASELKKIETRLREAIGHGGDTKELTDMEIELDGQFYFVDASVDYTVDPGEARSYGTDRNDGTEGYPEHPEFTERDVTITAISDVDGNPVQLPHNSPVLQQLLAIVYEKAVEESGEWDLSNPEW